MIDICRRAYWHAGRVQSFRVGFVVGVTPDKWRRRWEERNRRRLELVAIEQADQEQLLRSGELDMCLVRQPIRRDGIHLIPLYDEQPVVLAARDNVVAAYADATIHVDELRDEPRVDESLPLAAALDVVVADAGIMILPGPIARVHSRKDIAVARVEGVEPTRIGLAWLIDHDDPDLETFIGVVRGRSVTSSRGSKRA